VPSTSTRESGSTQRITLPPERDDPPTESHEPPTESHEPPTESHEPRTEHTLGAPPSERRTIQIGERPGPLRPAPLDDSALPTRARWTPRLIAIAALVAIVVIVVLLLLFAR